MRIIAGKYRGRKLKAVPGVETRPTSERVREALFDILGETVRSARVLDLFAGTGALGLEALSRGAGTAVLVENHPAARAAIESNISALGVQADADLLPLDCRAALALLKERGEKFDLVLADPPYRTGEGENLLSDIGRFAILSQDGITMIEHSPGQESALREPGWRLFLRKEYGRTVLSFYTHPPVRESGAAGPVKRSE